MEFAIKKVDFPIQNRDFPVRYVNVYHFGYPFWILGYLIDGNQTKLANMYQDGSNHQPVSILGYLIDGNQTKLANMYQDG